MVTKEHEQHENVRRSIFTTNIAFPRVLNGDPKIDCPVGKGQHAPIVERMRNTVWSDLRPTRSMKKDSSLHNQITLFRKLLVILGLFWVLCFFYSYSSCSGRNQLATLLRTIPQQKQQFKSVLLSFFSLLSLLSRYHQSQFQYRHRHHLPPWPYQRPFH